jgi:AAA domain
MRTLILLWSGAQRLEVFKWLQVTDPSPIHHRSCKQYEPKTGDWMLRSPEWRNWIHCKKRCLWIHGIPGAGKTVLASYLIEGIERHCNTLSEKHCAHIYYYCYFGHNQDEAAPFLRWIINRLCRQTDKVPTRLHDMFKQGGTPSFIDLMDTLELILATSFDTVYITIDAIDESMPRADLLKVLRDLATDARFAKIQLLATSRQYLDIERVMEEISVEVSMSNLLVDEDIRTYVRSQLHTLPKFKKWPPNLLIEGENALMLKAKGMWVN